MPMHGLRGRGRDEGEQRRQQAHKHTWDAAMVTDSVSFRSAMQTRKH